MNIITEAAVKRSRVYDCLVSQEIVEETFRQKKQQTAGSAQEVAMVPDSFASGAFYSLPAYLKKANIAGVKWTNHIPLTAAQSTGHSYTTPTILLNQLDTGARLAVIEGQTISGLRTAAVSANAVTYLAGLSSQSLLCCGAGFQAFYQLRALFSILPNLQDVYIWTRSEMHGQAFIQQLQQLPTVKGTMRFHFLSVLPRTLDFAEIVLGVTAATEPYLQATQFVPGQLYLHIGMNDIAPESLSQFDVIVCDDYLAGKQGSSQSLFRAARKQQLDEKKILLLEELIVNQAIAPKRSQQTWMFNSFGLAIFDLALAAAVYKETNE